METRCCTKMELEIYNCNNELVREFTCKYDCIKQLTISDKTLTKALDTCRMKVILNGWEVN